MENKRQILSPTLKYLQYKKHPKHKISLESFDLLEIGERMKKKISKKSVGKDHYKKEEFQQAIEEETFINTNQYLLTKFDFKITDRQDEYDQQPESLLEFLLSPSDDGKEIQRKQSE